MRPRRRREPSPGLRYLTDAQIARARAAHVGSALGVLAGVLLCAGFGPYGQPAGQPPPIDATIQGHS